MQLYEDQWGEIIDRPEAGMVEIRWYDTTADMSRSQFQDWLKRFAGLVEQSRRPGVLVDSTVFRMDMANMDGAWRDSEIIPRYNAAGVKRFAFHMPEGMPAIGTAPRNEAPGDFPTGYFGRRSDAFAWLGDAVPDRSDNTTPPKQVVVRYKVKPGRADENQRLIEAVFARLHADRPAGLRYTSMRLADGVSLVHVAYFEGDGNPLAALSEFGAFTKDIAERCDIPPDGQDATILGAYRLFGAPL